MKYGTPFVESEVILAALAEDEEEITRLLSGMLDGELRSLDRAYDTIYEALVAERVRRQRQASAGDVK